MKVYYSNITKLWYILCPICKVTHAFGIGHGFNGDFDKPTLNGSIGWTGVNNEGNEVYCHSIVTNGMIKIDEHEQIELPNITEP